MEIYYNPQMQKGLLPNIFRENLDKWRQRRKRERGLYCFWNQTVEIL